MKTIQMTERQHELVERFVVALMRAGETENASHMMALQIQYKFAEDFEAPRASNVIDFPGHSVKV